MRKIGVLQWILLAMLSLNLTGCAVVGDIFKAGMWTSIIIIVLIIVLVIWLFGRFRR
jgi:hypothetical protein